MTGVLRIVCLGILVAAGFGAARSAFADVSGVSVQVELVTYTTAPTNPLTSQSFSLTCGPAGGTLPLAARVCDDIERHPMAMLDPHRSGLRWVCLGTPFVSSPQEAVNVTATTGGTTTEFTGGESVCSPESLAAAIFFAAAHGHEDVLARLESQLRCDEDPALLVKPVPHASILGCWRGEWTPRIEGLIRLAKRARPIAALPASLFPADTGVQACAIPAGGPKPTLLAGRCGVYLAHPWSSPTLSFVEVWPSGKGTKSHVWRVVIRNGAVIETSESGPVPPQLWR